MVLGWKIYTSTMMMVGRANLVSCIKEHVRYLDGSGLNIYIGKRVDFLFGIETDFPARRRRLTD